MNTLIAIVIKLKNKNKNGMNIKVTIRKFLNIFDNIRIQLFMFMSIIALMIVHINTDMNTNAQIDVFNYS